MGKLKTDCPLIFDIEANGLLDTVSKVHCIVISDLEDSYDFTKGRIEEGIEILHNAVEMWGHNIIKYDNPAIKKLYPYYKPQGIIRDTMVASKLLWPDIKRHSLRAWGERLTEYKGDYEGGWEELTDEMLEYCYQDVKVTEALYRKIQDAQPSDQSMLVEHFFSEWVWQQERYGVKFNTEAGVKLYGELSTKRVQLEQQIRDVIPSIEKTKVEDFTPKRSNKEKGWDAGVTIRRTKVKTVQFNPGSRDHVAYLLKTKYNWKPLQFTDTGKPQIDESVLEKLPYPEAKLLNQYFLVNKRIGMLAEGDNAWLKLERNGRIHGNVNPIGTASHRASHNYPNLAQVPSNTSPYGIESRGLFTVSPTSRLVGYDASGLQLRLLAHYLARYDGGELGRVILDGDIHWRNTQAFGLVALGSVRDKHNPHHDSVRHIGKTAMYALLFGGGPGRLSIITGKPVKFGKQMISNFNKHTKGFKKLQDTLKETLKKQGFIKGLDGRRIPVSSDYLVLCYLLQAAEAVIMKTSSLIFQHKAEEAGLLLGRDYQQVLDVHDEKQIEVFNPDNAELIGQLGVASIVEAGLFYNLRCPLDGEYKIGSNWAQTH